MSSGWTSVQALDIARASLESGGALGQGVISSFVPEDRLRALAAGEEIATPADGAVLFVDVAGFTRITDTLVNSLGPQRGAEELTLLLDRVFAALVEAVEWAGGTVVAFAGDALSCWFEGDDGLQATSAALAMQTVMAPLHETSLPDGATATLAMRVAVATGTVERLVLGDPAMQVLEALSGAPVELAARGQEAATPGEVVLDERTARRLADQLEFAGERDGFAVVAGLRGSFTPAPPRSDVTVPVERLRPWVPRATYERVIARGDMPMAEIRPAVALFMALDDTSELDAAVRHAQHVLADYGGTLIDVTTGDKGTYLSGAFGVPVASGDDLLRSVAAAYELRAPDTRIGLAAGPVYASVYGAPRRRCFGLNGTTVNLAARLMQHAPPGEVRLSGGFGPSVARRFDIRRVPRLVLKGFPIPVPASKLVGHRTEPSVLPDEPRYTVPMVGRDAELATALAALDRVQAGSGQALLIAGVPGIGKSRLLSEVAQRAAATGFEVHAGAGDAVATIPYLAWQPIWRGLLGVAADDGEPELHAKLDGLFAPEQLPLLAPLLGVALADNEVTSTIPGPARTPIVHGLLRDYLTTRASTGPRLLLALEDCHWLDSLSRELLLEVASWQLPLLLLAASRPDTALELQPRIELAPLEADDAARLIELKLVELTGAAEEIPPELLHGVAERADGNPFFVEELLNHLHDLGARCLEGLDLPPTLHGLLLQRLDRLPSAQQLALKPAAVIGRRFSAEWVRTLDPRLGSPDEVSDSLEAVAAHDLIAHETDLSYLFKHIATWEAVYQSIPFAARAAWHGELAARLQEAGDVAPAVLAYHYRRAGDRANELRATLAAGEQAAAAGAYREAREQLQRGLDLVTADEPAIEIGLRLSLGGVFITTHGHVAPEAKAHYDRALALTDKLAPGSELVRALFGLWTYYLFSGDMRPTSELSSQILGLAQRVGDPELLLQAHFAVSATVYWLGEFAACIEHADAVDRLYDPAQASRYLTTYAQNPRVTAAADAAWAEWIVGRPDAARARAAATVEHARELEQPFVLTIALQVPAIVNLHIGDPAATAASAQDWLALASEVGNPVYVGLAAACLAWAGGDVEQLAEIRAGFVGQGVGILDPLLTTVLADAYLRAGDAGAGLALLDSTMGREAARHQFAYLAEQHRLRGEFTLLEGGDPTNDFKRALTLAREQGARSYELRAALSWSRLTGDVEPLRAARAAITEGTDTPDVRAVDTGG